MEKVRKELVGKVVSDKNNKTITVLVETYKKHPLYGKGDTVKIVETKPISKTKHFYLKEIVKEAVIL